MIHTLALVALAASAPQEDVRSVLPGQGDRRVPLVAETSAVREVVRSARAVRLIDVADLTGADRLKALRDAIADVRLDEEVRYASLERYLALVEKGEIEARASSLARAIETFGGLQSGSEGTRVVVASPSEIIVAAPEETQAWIDDFLASMRSFEGMIRVDLAVFELPSDSDLDLEEMRRGLVLDADGTQESLARVRAVPGVRTLQAPRITTFPAQRASLEVIEETPYIKDYELTVLPDQGVELADPVVDVVRAGTSVDLLAVPLGADRIAVEIEFSQTSAKKPYEQLVTTVGRSETPVTIQRPQVYVARLDAQFEVVRGQSIWVSVADPEDPKRELVVLLTARRIARPEPSKTEETEGEAVGGR